MTQRTKRLLLLAAGAWLVLTALAVSFGPVSVGTIERRLQANAQDALDRRGYSWAQVRMNGQVATLTGAAPDEDQQQAAIAIVRASTWSGGRVAGGITRVVDEMVAESRSRGFYIRADMISAGRVHISGGAATDAMRQEIGSFASATYSESAAVDLTIVPGGEEVAGWDEAVRRLLGQLARLEQGSIYLSGTSAALIGEAANPQIARSVTRALINMPEGYEAASVVTPAGAPAEVSITGTAGCHAVLRAARSADEDELRFDHGGVEPSPFTEVALRRMARVFQACPGEPTLRIEIGVEEGGAELAASRADRVRALMVQAGAPTERLNIELENDHVRLLQFEVESDEG